MITTLPSGHDLIKEHLQHCILKLKGSFRISRISKSLSYQDIDLLMDNLRFYFTVKRDFGMRHRKTRRDEEGRIHMNHVILKLLKVEIHPQVHAKPVMMLA